jgi:hypothetical protein
VNAAGAGDVNALAAAHGYGLTCDDALDELLRTHTNQQIADSDHTGWIRESWPEIGPGHRALLVWLADSREGTGYENGPLSLEQQTYEPNECDSAMGGDTLWIVAGDEVVAQGGIIHREILKQERSLRALTSRRLRLAGIARPFVRVRIRARDRRRRQTATRRARARSPGRQPAGPEPQANPRARAAA